MRLQEIRSRLTGAVPAATIVRFSCAGLLLNAGLVFAQPQPAEGGDDERGVTWEELQKQHGQALEARGWGKSYVFTTFDHDHDEVLDPEEQRMLEISLQVGEPDRSAGAVGADTSAADSHIMQTGPNAAVNPIERSNPTRHADDGAPSLEQRAPEELVGREVRSERDELMGRISFFVFDPEQDQVAAVLDSRDSGQQVLPLAELQLRNEQLVFSAPATDAVEYRPADYLPVAPEDYATLEAMSSELSEVSVR